MKMSDLLQQTQEELSQVKRYRAQFKEQQLKILRTLPVEELHVILNKYCRSDSTFLCEKKYGIRFDDYVVKEHLVEREIENILLQTPDKIK